MNIGCAWVEAIRRNPSNVPPEQSWDRAWEDLLLRANEKRDVLRAHLNGGLIFALPPTLKSLISSAAPDLWSVRSFVLDIEPVPLDLPESEIIARGFEVPAGGVAAGSGMALAMGKAMRLAETGAASVDSRLDAMVRATEAWKAKDAPPDSVHELLRPISLILMELESLYRELQLSLDGCGTKETIASPDNLCPRLQASKGEFASYIVMIRQLRATVQFALGHNEESELEIRLALEWAGRSPNKLDIVVTQRDLARFLRNMDRNAEAERAFQEAVAECRLLTTPNTSSSCAENELRLALEELSAILQQENRWAEAESAIRESIDLLRHLLSNSSKTEEPLRMLADDLNRLGNILAKQHRYVEADPFTTSRSRRSNNCSAFMGNPPEHWRFCPRHSFAWPRT